MILRSARQLTLQSVHIPVKPASTEDTRQIAVKIADSSKDREQLLDWPQSSVVACFILHPAVAIWRRHSEAAMTEGRRSALGACSRLHSSSQRRRYLESLFMGMEGDSCPAGSVCSSKRMGRGAYHVPGWCSITMGGAAGLWLDHASNMHSPGQPIKALDKLGHQTPLQAADIPILDGVAASGLNGLLDPVEPGLACGSDTAHLSILGFDPRRYYRGRGAFESMGAGIDMNAGDIAFKSNFATLNTTNGIVERRRADRIFEDLGPILCESLDGLTLPSFPQHAVCVRYATEHRCGVVVRGPGLSDAITGTDPLRDNLPLQEVRPTDDSEDAAHTAAVITELSLAMHQILQAHPINAARIAEGKPAANIVLLRGCGSRIAVEPFPERHGLRAAMVAPTKVIAGLGASLGFDIILAPGATGDYRTQLSAKAEAIADALIHKGYHFAFLHVKAVDDTGHDRLPMLKVKFLEALDVMVAQLLCRLWQAEQPPASSALSSPGTLSPAQDFDQAGPASAGSSATDTARAVHPGFTDTPRFAICITGDHSTPVAYGDHSHEPVPFALAHVQDAVEGLGGAAWVGSVPMQPVPPPEAAASTAPGTLQRRQVSHAISTSGDAVAKFDEISAAGGSLGRFPGQQVMPLIKSFMSLRTTLSAYGS
ncbi:hypothetical protein WJX74_007188 [Apatococcus lobatus]|uniref:Metalloenzyme domain-containing protein n=1 Tax=Apatococcus lobatus TaxID=904363 RepID=A0AAW1QYN5_9CHLO